jgi:hypothetical protein
MYDIGLVTDKRIHRIGVIHGLPPTYNRICKKVRALSKLIH